MKTKPIQNENQQLVASSKPLGLRPKEAAQMLGIGERKLWNLTYPRGPIPCVRVGKCVIYPVALLEAWLAEQATKEMHP